jgi:hypothetical protein
MAAKGLSRVEGAAPQGASGPAKSGLEELFVMSLPAVPAPRPSYFRERPLVGCDGSGDGPAINELPFATTGDQPGFAQSFEMVRDGCGGHAAHRDDLATVHVVGCRDGFEDPEASLACLGL